MKRVLKKCLLSLTMISSLLLAFPSFAIGIDQAKSQGLIGEMPNGLIASVAGNPAKDVRQLISSVNKKRLSHYQSIAQRNNISIQSVQAIAAKEAYQRTLRGNYIYVNNSWQRKK